MPSPSSNCICTSALVMAGAERLRSERFGCGERMISAKGGLSQRASQGGASENLAGPPELFTCLCKSWPQLTLFSLGRIQTILSIHPRDQSQHRPAAPRNRRRLFSLSFLSLLLSLAPSVKMVRVCLPPRHSLMRRSVVDETPRQAAMLLLLLLLLQTGRALTGPIHLQSSPRPSSPVNSPAAASGSSTARPSSPPAPGGARTQIRRRAAADQKEKIANTRPSSTRAAGAGGSSSTMLSA